MLRETTFVFLVFLPLGKEAAPLKRLLVYLTHYKKECVIAPAFKMLEALFDLFVPLVMANIIDVGIPAGDTGYILRRAALLVLLGLVGLGCSIVAQYYAARAAVGFSAGVRRALFQHIQRLSVAQLEQEGAATLITRMTSDVNQTQNGVNMVLRLFLRSPFIVLGSLVMAFTIDLRAALIFAGAIPLLFLIVFGVMALTVPGYRRVQDRLDGVMRLTRENLTGVRVVRAFGREADEQQRFQTANRALNAAQQRVGRISSLMNPLTYVVVNLAVVAILYSGALSIQVGSLQQGDVIALVNYMSQVLVELVKLANLVVLVTRSLASASRIAAVLDITPEEGGGQAVPDIHADGDPAAVFGGHLSGKAGLHDGGGAENDPHDAGVQICPDDRLRADPAAHLHLKAGLCGDPADECQIRGQAGFCALKIHQMQIFGPGFPKAQRHRQRIRAVNGHLPVVSFVKPDGLPFIEIDGWKYVHGEYLTIHRMRAGWTGPPRRSFPDGTGSRRCFPGPRRRSDPRRIRQRL